MGPVDVVGAVKGREEGGVGEGGGGGGRLEQVGGQQGVTTRPDHLLTLVLHTPVLEPDLKARSMKTWKFKKRFYSRLF